MLVHQRQSLILLKILVKKVCNSKTKAFRVMPLVSQLHLVMISKYSKFGVDNFNTFLSNGLSFCNDKTILETDKLKCIPDCWQWISECTVWRDMMTSISIIVPAFALGIIVITLQNILQLSLSFTFLLSIILFFSSGFIYLISSYQNALFMCLNPFQSNQGG